MNDGDGAAVGVGRVADGTVLPPHGRGATVGNGGGLGGAEGEGERGGAIGMSIGRGMDAVKNVPAVGGYAVDGIEILTDVAADSAAPR